jgi:hypothetical protein
MHARGPQFRPEVSHGIQANDVGPLSYVNEEYFRHLQKHFRVLEVQVYLVRAECGPYGLLAIQRAERRQQF